MGRVEGLWLLGGTVTPPRMFDGNPDPALGGCAGALLSLLLAVLVLGTVFGAWALVGQLGW